MKHIIKIISAFLALTALFTALSLQAQDQATSLDQLLEKVREGRVAESREQKQREQEFQKAKDKQLILLNQAKADRAAEERKSEQLEEEYTKNEEQLTLLSERMRERLGALRELFGVLQQVAGDTRGKFESSIISLQYPGRDKFLDVLAKKMGTSTELATIEEIERVVYELQREMTESAKVSRFNAQVLLPDGNKEEREVVRVGTFNVISNGKYLDFEAEKNNVTELQRQPASRYTSTIDDLQSASGGIVPFALDPARGSVLKVLVQVPDLSERIHQGGTIGYITMAAGFFALLIALQRMLALSTIGRKVTAQIGSNTASEDNPLGRVLMVHDKNKNIDTETLELKLNEAILKETPDLIKFISLLKIIAVVAPLLGLLGTVTGMINTFQAITLFGTGDPKVMAGGISQALVTTVQGLCVAIPITLLHSIVNSRSKSIIHILEEQSAGIIAAHNERSRKG